MTEPIKMPQEELDNILILREKIRANVESIGRLNIKKHFINLELKSAQEDLAHAYEESERLAAELGMFQRENAMLKDEIERSVQTLCARGG